MFGLTCEKSSQLFSNSLDKDLSLGQRFLLKLHLMMCGACSESAEQIKKLHMLFNELTHPLEDISSIKLPQPAKERIYEAINNK